MSISKRLAALEQRAQTGNDITIVKVEGGLPGLDLKTAQAGQHSWTQHDAEGAEAFQARVIAEARAAGEKLVIIGGLPDLTQPS